MVVQSSSKANLRRAWLVQNLKVKFSLVNKQNRQSLIQYVFYGWNFRCSFIWLDIFAGGGAT